MAQDHRLQLHQCIVV